MWVIGIVCMGLMLMGHAFTQSGHGSHSHDRAAAPNAVATAAAPDRAAAEAAPENAPQPEPGHHP
jgi:predicted cobalt transporter CbtA